MIYGPSSSTASTGFALPYRIRLATSKLTPTLSRPTSLMARTSVMGVSCPVSQRNVWPFCLQYCGHGADGVHGLGVERLVGVLGNESAVRLHAGNAGFLGEIRHLLDARDARLAILARRQPDGQRPLIEIVNLRARDRRRSRKSLPRRIWPSRRGASRRRRHRSLESPTGRLGIRDRVRA